MLESSVMLRLKTLRFTYSVGRTRLVAGSNFVGFKVFMFCLILLYWFVNGRDDECDYNFDV